MFDATASLNILSGPEQAPASGKVKQLVMFLHGLGADGNDLISLAPLMVDALPDTQFVSPDAPFDCDLAPYGRQWFSFRDTSSEQMLNGVSAAAVHLNHFIDAKLKQYHLPISKLAVVGFSQGTMTALHTLLRRADPCAAIVGFSGGIIASNRLHLDIRCKPPVCLIHGDADNVVPYAQMIDAEAALHKSDVEVESHTRPGLAHGIDPEGLEIAAMFIKKRFL